MKAKAIYIFLFCIVALLAIASWVWIYDPFCLICPKPSNPQQSAMGSIRTIGTAQGLFHDKKGRYGTWQEIADEGFIGPALATGIKSGYRFEIRLGEKEFEAFATPVKVGKGATYSFYLSSLDGQIRRAEKQGKEADINDPIVE
jgi:hypothetical protein